MKRADRTHADGKRSEGKSLLVCSRLNRHLGPVAATAAAAAAAAVAK